MKSSRKMRSCAFVLSKIKNRKFASLSNRLDKSATIGGDISNALATLSVRVQNYKERGQKAEAVRRRCELRLSDVPASSNAALVRWRPALV